MGRVSRIEYERAVYHVIQRGNNKEFIFKEDQFKAYFLKSMEKLIQELNFSLFGYVLMNNHYHLLLQMHDKPLQSLMHKLNTKYARYYNYKSDRVGHVFQGRYQSLLVRD